MGWAKKKGKQQEGRLYLTKVIPLKGEEWLDKFKEPMLAATKIWNSCVWESKQAAKEGKEYPTESELKAKFKHYQSWKKLHSQSAQNVVENYFEAVRSYNKHKENGHDEMKPPNYKSKYLWRTIRWKNGNKAFEYKNNTITLKFSRKMESVAIPLPEGANMLMLPDGTKLNGTPIEVKVKAVYQKKEVSNLQLHVTWDYGLVPVSVNDKVSAYDINSAVVARTSTEGSRQLIMCREILSLVQYRNKVIAEFQSRMSKLKDGSKKMRKLSQAKGRILKKLERRINQLINSLTKLMSELDKEENISVSLLGDLTDLRRSAQTGDKNKVASQKINQMPYSKVENQHSYKSLMKQIESRKADERYSSQTCSRCGVRNKEYRIERGLWVCEECGEVIHADINGSTNILKNYLFGRCDLGWLLRMKPVEVYRWDRKYNVFKKVSPSEAA